MDNSEVNVSYPISKDQNTNEDKEQLPGVHEVFSMFKSYIEDKLGQQEEQIDSKARIDKKVSLLKFKGNQKQFEHNALLEVILTRIKSENQSANTTIETLVDKGKEIIRKRQKLIQIADKSVDGWKVVEEYISDDLASDSADEKRMKRARDTVGRKRKQSSQRGNADRRFKDYSPVATDQRFFQGKHKYDQLIVLEYSNYFIHMTQSYRHG